MGMLPIQDDGALRYSVLAQGGEAVKGGITFESRTSRISERSSSHSNFLFPEVLRQWPFL